MRMVFIFDKNKLKEHGYEEEQCLNAIRRHFEEYKSKTIKEIKKGVFEGSEDDWNYNIPINVDTIKEGYPILCA